MRVAVTGAGGFLGRAIVAELSAAGHDVTASDRPGVEIASAGARQAVAELLDAPAVRRLVRGHDAVVHCAGLFDLSAGLERLEAANVASVRHVVDACRTEGIGRLVHLSSVAVYGRPRRTPCAESEPHAPRHAYEATKARGERVAAESGLPTTIVRPTLVYGPFSRYAFGLFLGGMCLLAAGGRARLRALRRGAAVHTVQVEDVARAVAFALREPATIGQSFNLADDTPLSMTDALGVLGERYGVAVEPWLPDVPALRRPLLEALARRLPQARIDAWNRGIERSWRRLAEKVGFAAAFVPRVERDWLFYAASDHVYDNRRLKTLGFSYRWPSFADGMRATLDWYVASGWLPEPGALRRYAEARARRRATVAGA
jgi:nucleoside-diphosphate-sugar epimerase